MHGYEMIQEIAERSGGAWKPSPVRSTRPSSCWRTKASSPARPRVARELLSLTDEGREAAEAGPEAPWEEAGRGVDWETLHEIRQAGFGLMEAFGQVWKTGGEDQRDKALAVINEARKKLYLILADED